MAEEVGGIKQMDVGGPGGRNTGGGQSGGGSEEEGDGKKKKEKSPQEKAKEAQDKIEKTRKNLKRAQDEIEKAPERLKQLKEGAEKAVRGGKQIADAASRTAKAAADASRPAIEASRQAAIQVANQVAAATARVAAAVAEKAAQVASKVAEVAVKLLANPYVLAAVLIIVIVMIMFHIFMGSVNGINSLAGGSIFVPADYNNPVHQQIVEHLKQKMSGCDPKLVIYDGGISDIDWQVDPDSGAHTNKLDIRLLKTLDYLTDKHRIRIDLLKTGAPDLIRDSFLEKKAQYSQTGQDQVKIKETLSAFATGQAMAISEIDRTKIPELQSADMACGVPVPAPIEVGWQRTVGEKTIRPIWEELAYDVGFVDKNISIYQDITSGDDPAELQQLAKSYKLKEPVDGAYDLYKETFQKLPRIVELIDRALAYGNANFQGDQALDPRTLAYLATARDSLAPVAVAVSNTPFAVAAGGVNPGMSDEEVAAKIKSLGTPEDVASLRTGIRFVYKATQVKNSVNWDKKKKNGDLTYVKASESRNKIRQVEAELLEMPRETSLDGIPVLFDQNLVVKQIIAFSPEDDLDNGLENLDIFPRGMVSVDTGGVAMETLTVDSQTGNAVGDGKVDYADVQFSHAPIDNGTFSKNGTNYVYKEIHPEDSGWKKAGAFIWNYLTLPGQLLSANDKLHDLVVGGCIAGLNETCRKVNYRDFLPVSF